MVSERDSQWIARLTPVDEVLAAIDRLVAPIAPRAVEVAAATSCVLAEDVAAAADRPHTACALRDGFAVDAEAVADASSYGPVPLTSSPVRVDIGDALPAATNAVAPLDAFVHRDGQVEAIASITPGEGVLAAGEDVRLGAVLRRAGERLRDIDIAVLRAAGIERLAVRLPCIRLAHARAGQDTVLGAAGDLIGRAIGVEGGLALVPPPTEPATGGDLADALADESVDAVIAIGGTGCGRGDASVRTLARLGGVEVHGMALTPGETAAFGFAGRRPVLLIPGRLDAALAAWLVIGRRLLARLCASTAEQPAVPALLARKIASPLGLTEVVPVRRHGGQAEPLATGYWPLQAIAQADGWVMVPPESEGYPLGAEVMVRALP